MICFDGKHVTSQLFIEKANGLNKFPYFSIAGNLPARYHSTNFPSL